MQERMKIKGIQGDMEDSIEPYANPVDKRDPHQGTVGCQVLGSPPSCFLSNG